jgi:D-glycerate 3-kinase
MNPFENAELASRLQQVALADASTDALSDNLSDTLTDADQAQLETAILATAWQTEGLGITAETVAGTVAQRVQRLQTLYPTLNQFCQETLGWHCPIDLLWQLWLPLAEQIVAWQSNPPLILGILGGQGTGKTTLTLLLGEILTQLGFQVCRLSIDDLYKTYAERQQLQQRDPRLRWRGPPGTHDIELGQTVLDQLRRAAFPVAVPRFDKSAHQGAGDRTDSDWVTAADIVLFEGWFVGVRPIDPQAFDQAPPPIDTEADRDFARDINLQLQAYLPLWDQLDRLIVLYPSDYRLSQQWRQQAEQQMMASGRSGMSAAEVKDFVTYFWRALHPTLFIQPLLHQSDQVDLVIEIDANHRPGSIYCP